jgi:predicted ester cyclase/ketosteroid isomerase-like protein
MRIAVLILSALIVASGRASVQAEEPPQEPSVTLPEPLARVLADYERAWQGKDAAALAALFAEDGFVLSSGSPPVRGRARIEKHYAGQGGPLALRALAFATDGSLGYIIGGFAREKGQADRGKFTLTLHKGAGGRWFIVSDMDNDNTRLPVGGATGHGDEVEQNKRVVRRLYEEVFSNWNLAVIDELISPEFVGHEMPPGTPPGPEGFRQFYAGIRDGLPDVQLTVEDMIGERDRVVVRWRGRATHRGPFLGIPATGGPVSLTGIAIYRLSNGKVVERWVEVDLLGVTAQMRAAQNN